MYTVHNHSIDNAPGRGIKFDSSCRKTASKSSGVAPPSSRPCHEAIATVEKKAMPWMKNVTLSSRDLMWDSCSETEESFMSIPKPISPPPNSRSISRASTATPLSSQPSMSAIMEPPLLRNNDSDSLDENDSLHSSRQLPRFRQDKIMDHEDVEIQVGDLKTTMQRSVSSSDSIPMPALEDTLLKFSESFVASQEEILQRIQHSSASNSQSSLQFADERRASPPSSQNGSFREETFDGNGSKIRIHDEERVYAAMDKGTARILQCIGCSKHMMATNDIELVFCPACGTVTPLEIARAPSASLDTSQPILPNRR